MSGPEKVTKDQLTEKGTECLENNERCFARVPHERLAHAASALFCSLATVSPAIAQIDPISAMRLMEMMQDISEVVAAYNPKDTLKVLIPL